MSAAYRPAIQFWRPLVAFACGVIAAPASSAYSIATATAWDFVVVAFLLGALAGLVGRGWPGPVAVVAGDLLGTFALGGTGGLQGLVAIILGVLLVHGYAAAWVVLRWRRSGATRFFADPLAIVVAVIVVALPVVYWFVLMSVAEGPP